MINSVYECISLCGCLQSLLSLLLSKDFCVRTCVIIDDDIALISGGCDHEHTCEVCPTQNPRAVLQHSLLCKDTHHHHSHAVHYGAALCCIFNCVLS